MDWLRFHKGKIAVLACCVLLSVFSAFPAYADYAVYSSSGEVPYGPDSSANTTPGVIYAPGVKAPHAGETPAQAASDTAVSVTDTGDGGQIASGNAAGPGAAVSDAAETAPTGEEAAGAADQAAQAAAATAAAANGSVIPVEGNPQQVMSAGRIIDLTRPMLALTYDDGPRTDVGNRIMDVFETNGQRCTFFMVGDRVASRASEVQRMAADGFELANHTYSHTYLNKVGADTIRQQVAACNDVIEQISGIRPRLMRLPGGNKNQTVLANVNMPIILWNIDTLDWKTRDTASTVNAVLGKVKDGDIVLMHELYESTAAATEILVPALVEQGFQLVTVSELAACKNIALQPGALYYSIR